MAISNQAVITINQAMIITSAFCTALTVALISTVNQVMTTIIQVSIEAIQVVTTVIQQVTTSKQAMVLQYQVHHAGAEGADSKSSNLQFKISTNGAACIIY
jgi:hypothetical protein